MEIKDEWMLTKTAFEMSSAAWNLVKAANELSKLVSENELSKLVSESELESVYAVATDAVAIAIRAIDVQAGVMSRVHFDRRVVDKN